MLLLHIIWCIYFFKCFESNVIGKPKNFCAQNTFTFRMNLLSFFFYLWNYFICDAIKINFKWKLKIRYTWIIGYNGIIDFVVAALDVVIVSVIDWNLCRETNIKVFTKLCCTLNAWPIQETWFCTWYDKKHKIQENIYCSHIASYWKFSWKLDNDLLGWPEHFINKKKKNV